jgi:hypothetical protein
MEKFDMTLDKAPDAEHVIDPREPVIIESDHDEERENIAPQPEPPPEPVIIAKPLIIHSTKRKPEGIKVVSPNKRTSTGKVTADQREATRSQLLEKLNRLEPPGTVPQLFFFASRRLEQDLYDKVLTDRDGGRNVLGRSSTLVTTRKRRDIIETYTKEKEKLIQKVEEYVQMATHKDVTEEAIRRGDIWDVFREILDQNK